MCCWHKIEELDDRCGLQKSIDNGEELINELDADEKTKQKWRDEIEWAKEIMKDPQWP